MKGDDFDEIFSCRAFSSWRLRTGRMMTLSRMRRPKCLCRVQNKVRSCQLRTTLPGRGFLTTLQPKQKIFHIELIARIDSLTQYGELVDVFLEVRVCRSVFLNLALNLSQIDDGSQHE